MEGDCLGFGSGGKGMFCSVLVGGWVAGGERNFPSRVLAKYLRIKL
jgi:hypothetical protein